MTLPEIRDRLLEIAQERDIPELIELAHQMRRRYHGRKAPVSSAPMTPELASQIQLVARMFPKMTQHKIANLFGVTGGRVSEALFGKRQ